MERQFMVINPGSRQNHIGGYVE